jgi:DNA modification methylase
MTPEDSVSVPMSPSIGDGQQLPPLDTLLRSEDLGVGPPRTVADETGVSPRNALNDLSGREWIAETKSVWFQKGLGANHLHARIEREHPAPYSFQDVARLIRFFTKAGGRVLDPFLGVGSTLKACALLGRVGVGIELVPRWVELSRRRLAEEVGPHALASQEVVEGDSRKVLADSVRYPDESFDFSVCSPPYWAILTKKADHKVVNERVSNGLATKYSEDPADLGNIGDYETFLREISSVFAHVHRLLKPGAYACIVVGDFRHRSKYVAYHADLLRLLTTADVAASRYELQGVTVLVQNNKSLYPYGYPYAYVQNVHHQYILILRKPRQAGYKSARDRLSQAG